MRLPVFLTAALCFTLSVARAEAPADEARAEIAEALADAVLESPWAKQKKGFRSLRVEFFSKAIFGYSVKEDRSECFFHFWREGRSNDMLNRAHDEDCDGSVDAVKTFEKGTKWRVRPMSKSEHEFYDTYLPRYLALFEAVNDYKSGGREPASAGSGGSVKNNELLQQIVDAATGSTLMGVARGEQPYPESDPILKIWVNGGADDGGYEVYFRAERDTGIGLKDCFLGTSDADGKESALDKNCNARPEVWRGSRVGEKERPFRSALLDVARFARVANTRFPRNGDFPSPRVERSFAEGVAAYRQQDYETAREIWLPLARRGNEVAQYNLGVLYDNGRGVERDYAEAIKWYRKAAEQGHASAQLNLGFMYDDGLGVKRDYAKAAKWYRKAAEQGDAKAQYNLGISYSNGEGVERDDSKAVRWFRKAAEQGHAKAQYNLGVSYNDGEGVGRDYAEAIKWYRKAAEQDHASAQLNLGFMYKRGLGVRRDYSKAVKWYRRAADQGNESAQFNLGVNYKKGEGVKRDYAKAVIWYRKAAEQGHASAQLNLGYMHSKGQGVQRNLVQAYLWYSFAAQQGNAQAIKNRRIIAGQMSSHQKKFAKLMEMVWRKKCRDKEWSRCGEP